MKHKRMSNEQHVTNLINWHRFINDLLDQNVKEMKDYIAYTGSIDTESKLRQYIIKCDKLNFLTQEQYKAEHDLIDAAIIYNVPHTKMLKNGHAEDFYILLTAKARDIDKKGGDAY